MQKSWQVAKAWVLWKYHSAFEAYNRVMEKSAIDPELKEYHHDLWWNHFCKGAAQEVRYYTLRKPPAPPAPQTEWKKPSEGYAAGRIDIASIIAERDGITRDEAIEVMKRELAEMKVTHNANTTRDS